MASKKDMRRADLVIPYVPPKIKESDASDMLGTVAGGLPMVSMITRNKLVAWAGFIAALQAWLNETPLQLAAGKQPAYFPVGMSIMTLVIVYMPLFLPGRFPGPATISGLGYGSPTSIAPVPAPEATASP